LTITYSGFLGTDDESVLDTIPSISTTALQHSNTGTYGIILTGGADNNYHLNLVNGNLFIGKNDLIVKADKKSKIYGDPNPSLSITYSGFKGTDDFTVLDALPTASTTAGQMSNAGFYLIMVNGGSDNNYSFTYFDDTLTIIKALLTITAEDKTKNYGDPNPTLTIKYTGFILSDNESVLDTLPSVSTLITDTTSAGIYPNSIIVVGGQDNNYLYDYKYGNFTINAILPSVKIDSISSITKNSALCYSQLTSSGGTNLIQKGVCWSLTANPTIADSHSLNGSGTGAFIANMTNLLSLSTYYVRPYATNSVGTVYGTELSFTTLVNSIANEEFAKILLYPNPVDDQLFIELPEELLSCHNIEIYDLFGKIVYTEFCNNRKTIEINTSQLSKGLYLVRIKGERSYLGRFVKI